MPSSPPAPFTDLVPGSPHNANIDAIYNAGVTTGCVPNQEYCPTRNVTREEMASFLARLGGLGSNPPVANAKTAQTATNATSAASATDAAHLGGQPPSAYLPSSGPLTMRYNFYAVRSPSGAVTVLPAPNSVAIVSSTASTTAPLYLGLDRPSGLFGVNLAIASLQVCYATTVGGRITATNLFVGEKNEATDVYHDTTVRPATANAFADTCYTVTPPTVQAYGGALVLGLTVSLPLTSDNVYLDSVKLVLTPTAAGAAEAPLPQGPSDR